ncbi:MAG: helix-turn-helix domain-containing protein [Lachnospiraceae bacterium]|nr:helix-turn-helix domain-containing protein [Lachnospiraceae bacterium]
MNQEAIGKFISTCRKDKGLTQIQLAEKLNITNRAVSKWETGKSCPDASIMLNLCDILGITVNELLSGERISMYTQFSAFCLNQSLQYDLFHSIFPFVTSHAFTA